jgi:hypothetical protein
MASSHDAPRGATVVALTRCQLLIILDADDFRAPWRNEPPHRRGDPRIIAEQRRQQTPPQPPPAGISAG